MTRPQLPMLGSRAEGLSNEAELSGGGTVNVMA